MRRSMVMSKKFQLVRLFLGVLGLTLQFFTFAAAQDMSVTLTIDAKRPSELRVSGVFTRERSVNESHILAFSESVAGVDIPASRFSSATANDDVGIELQLVTVPRCCIATGKIKRFSYVVDLGSRGDIRAEAHTSWIRDGIGILMLGDLLPQEFLPTGDRRSAKVALNLPNDWRFFASDPKFDKRSISVADVDNSIIFVGKHWNEQEFGQDERKFSLLSNGEFHFTQAESQEKVRTIAQAYSKKFGNLNGERFLVAILRSTASTSFGAWEANTRGRTAMIVSAGMAFKSQSLQQLDEQLRHELFHLWIPNGVNLRGRYDWFYEGFALYSSLKLAVESNTIRFDDMLDTMSRAFAVADEQRSEIGLIKLTKNRFNGGERQLYSKGLIFAFYCDLALNVASKGRKNTDLIVNKIFQKYQNDNVRRDGPETVLNELISHVELRPLVEQYVTIEQDRDPKPLIDIDSLLENSGLEFAVSDGHKRLKVRTKLSSRQKAILDKLGYNSWRKLVKDSK